MADPHTVCYKEEVGKNRVSTDGSGASGDGSINMLTCSFNQVV